MFESIIKFFKRSNKKEEKISSSKSAAKERLHLVLMQDRANVSADFLELMKQEIIEVIKKYIEVDESAIDVRLTNKENEDGTNGAPALYANIPIVNIKNETRKIEKAKNDEQKNKDDIKQEDDEQKNIKQDESIEENKEDKVEEKEKQKSEISEINKEEIEKTASTNKEQREDKIESNK